MIINSQQQDNSERVIPISEGGFGTSSEEEFYNLLLNIIRPIGSLYITSEAVHPSNLFGGEWEQITDTYLATAGDLYPVAQYSGQNEKTIPVIKHSHGVYVSITSTGSQHSHGFIQGDRSTQPLAVPRYLNGSRRYDIPTQNYMAEANLAEQRHSHSASGYTNYQSGFEETVDVSPISFNMYIWRRVS